MDLIFRGLTYFDNTNCLDMGDVIIAVPSSINKFKKDIEIRKAVVVEKSQNALRLFDYDKRKLFYWDLNCYITDKNFRTFIINRY